LVLSWPTVFYTLLLGLILLYLLFMAFGALGAESIEPDLDLDLDLDVDVDVDLDLDLEVDADVDGDIGELADTVAGGRKSPWYPFKALLVWLNVGRVPLLFLIGLATPVAWLASVGLSSGELIAALQDWHTTNFFLAGAVGLLGGKFLTAPFIPLFRRMMNEAKDVDYIGLRGRLLLSATEERFGQAEIRHEDDFLLVNVKPANGQRELPKGEEIVIIGRTPDQRFYLAEPAEAFPEPAP